VQLPQGELNGDFDDHVDGFTPPSRRAEPPLANRGDSTLIQAGATSLEDRYVANGTIAPHDNFENDIAGDSTAPRLVGVLGLHLAQQSRRFDSTARPERATAGSSAGAVTDA
jgi:hypothetical protein